MIKISITGPESSGKSTLAAGLANKLQVPFVPEYARCYFSETYHSNYSLDDIERIAHGQAALLDLYSVNQELLISDTDFLVLKIWAEEKFAKSPPIISNLWSNISFDLYLLCKPNLEWVADDLRENPHDRDRLFDIYLHHLTTSKRKFGIIDHLKPEHRVIQAEEMIDELMFTINQIYK